MIFLRGLDLSHIYTSIHTPIVILVRCLFARHLHNTLRGLDYIHPHMQSTDLVFIHVHLNFTCNTFSNTPAEVVVNVPENMRDDCAYSTQQRDAFFMSSSLILSQSVRRHQDRDFTMAKGPVQSPAIKVVLKGLSTYRDPIHLSFFPCDSSVISRIRRWHLDHHNASIDIAGTNCTFASIILDILSVHKPHSSRSEGVLVCIKNIGLHLVSSPSPPLAFSPLTHFPGRPTSTSLDADAKVLQIRQDPLVLHDPRSQRSAIPPPRSSSRVCTRTTGARCWSGKAPCAARTGGCDEIDMSSRVRIELVWEDLCDGSGGVS